MKKSEVVIFLTKHSIHCLINFIKEVSINMPFLISKFILNEQRLEQYEANSLTHTGAGDLSLTMPHSILHFF